MTKMLKDRSKKPAAPTSTRRMLRFHEVYDDGTIGPDRYIAVADIHTIDAVGPDVPVYKEGVRAFIRGRGNNAFLYRVVEEAEALVALIEATPHVSGERWERNGTVEEIDVVIGFMVHWVGKDATTPVEDLDVDPYWKRVR